MTALTLIHDGELLPAIDARSLLAAAGIQSLRDAETVQLADFTDKADELRRIADEAKGAVSDEILRRLDMGGKWTLHEGPFKLSAPSPSAGSVGYDVDKLRAALADLATAEVISAEGANGAVETIAATASVPYALLRRVLDSLDGELDLPDEATLRADVEDVVAAEPEPTYKLRLGGVDRLRKIPAAREAIEECRVDLPAPRRRAKVTRS